jgi:predicted RNase H-like nuclease
MSNVTTFESWLSNRNDTKNLIRDAMDEIYNDGFARNHVKNMKCIREYVNNTKRISSEEFAMFYGFVVDYYEELRMKEYYV